MATVRKVKKEKISSMLKKDKHIYTLLLTTQL